MLESIHFSPLKATYFRKSGLKSCEKGKITLSKDLTDHFQSWLSSESWQIADRDFRCSDADHTYGKFFINSTEFDKNISNWSHDCTDHKNGNLKCFLSNSVDMMKNLLETIQVLRQPRGGWGQKMAISADLQYWRRWVGGTKKAKNMLT